MATHRQPHRPPDAHAALSSRRRPCGAPRVVLAPAGYLPLDESHEEAALCALADLLSAVTDQREEAA
ncbi:MAG: hypothetical protein M0Z95_19320 [Actinomycetota bacterium]|nr:hypothetical protein [Actinomycetota bacterium]MDA8358385.1 hypothetical protein [Actinomycetota bacterium]